MIGQVHHEAAARPAGSGACTAATPGAGRSSTCRPPTASLAVNYRSEFGHLLDSRGFDTLIQQIRTHTEREAVLRAENRAILVLIRGLRAGELSGQGACINGELGLPPAGEVRGHLERQESG